MHLFRRYGLSKGWHNDPYEGSSWNLKLSMISVVFKHEIILKVFVYDKYNIINNNKNFITIDDNRYKVELYPFLYELLNNKLEIFSIIIESYGFNMISKLNFDGLNVFDYICKIIKKESVYYTIFRDCFSRTVSMYNYLNSNKSKHEPTHKKIAYNTFEEYIKSYQLEDSWSDVKVGGTLAIAGAAKLLVKVVSVNLDDRQIVVAPQWTGAKYPSGPMSKRAGDPTWRGRRMVLLEDFPAILTERTSFRVHDRAESGFDILDYFRRPVAVEVDLDEGDEQ